MPELKHSFAEGELVGDNYRILSVAGTGLRLTYEAPFLRHFTAHLEPIS